MKQSTAAAAICLSLLAGCRHAEEKSATPPPVLAEEVHSPKANSPQPYYYGLVEEYRTILEEDPKNFAAVVALGNAYFDSGHWQEAIRWYERARTLNPRNPDVLTDLGTAYRNAGEPARALAQYRRALELEPGHVEAHYNMGIVYAYDIRDYAVATRMWEELLRIAPNHPHAAYVRSSLALFKKRLKKDAQ